MSPRALVAVAAAMSLGFGVLLAYVYYPSPRFILSDVANVRVELYQMIKGEDLDECERRLDQLENLLSKIPVAHFLRHGKLSAEQEEMRKELIQRLDVLREFIEVEDFAAAKTIITYAERAHRKLRQSFATAYPTAASPANTKSRLS